MIVLGETVIRCCYAESRGYTGRQTFSSGKRVLIEVFSGSDISVFSLVMSSTLYVWTAMDTEKKSQ
jgi:hypothetical protein